jgi:hypothetical protein
MKKIVFLIILTFIIWPVYSQVTGTAPTKEKVAQAANILGVSEEDLQEWIDSMFIFIPKDTPNLTALQFYDVYDDSRSKADQLYKDKQILLTGIVASIEEEHDSNTRRARYCIKLKTSTYTNFIRLFFDDSYVTSIFNVSVDNTITVLGTVTYKGAFYINLDHCRIIN